MKLFKLLKKKPPVKPWSTKVRVCVTAERVVKNYMATHDRENNQAIIDGEWKVELSKLTIEAALGDDKLLVSGRFRINWDRIPTTEEIDEYNDVVIVMCDPPQLEKKLRKRIKKVIRPFKFHYQPNMWSDYICCGWNPHDKVAECVQALTTIPGIDLHYGTIKKNFRVEDNSPS